MDVVLDTNIIKQENFLRSKKFLALLDYLKKTNSRIVLPQIVKEESISLFEQEILSQLKNTRREIGKLSKLCFSPIGTNLNTEVIKEINAYISYIQKLNKDKLLYEIPYDDTFLHEVIFRMINRKKPCNQKGEECRDVILWLSIKNLIRKEKSVAFISNNSNEFASAEKTDLHPDLRAELSKEKFELKYYLNLDDFIKNHASKVDYITREWIEKQLPKNDLEHFIINLYTKDNRLIDRVEWKTGKECIDADPIDISSELDDFYVYEMMSGDIYLHLIIYCLLETEAVFEKTGTEVLEIETFVAFPAKVLNKEIKEIEVEEFLF